MFPRPEDLKVVVEYLNPSYLVKKRNGGLRLVTTFSDVGRYSKPRLANVDSTLLKIACWKYIIASNLSQAFYKIPLSRKSLKYCGVVTAIKGVRVYTRCAMGVPGSQTALEELMCRVLFRRVVLLRFLTVVTLNRSSQTGRKSSRYWTAVTSPFHQQNP